MAETPETMTFNDMARAEGPGMWAGVVEGIVPTDPEIMQYLVERTASGLWAISLKGYDEGEPVPVNGGPGLGFTVGQGPEKQQVVSPHSEFVPVDPDEMDDFREAVHGPEARDYLFVQALESTDVGVWKIYEPFNEDFTESTKGMLIRDGSGRLALGHSVDHECERGYDRRHHQPRVDFADAALLDPQGVQLSVISDGVVKFRLNSIAERTKPRHPHKALCIANIWTKHRMKLAEREVSRAYGDVESDLNI